jgi:hypothetical protein
MRTLFNRFTTIATHDLARARTAVLLSSHEGPDIAMSTGDDVVSMSETISGRDIAEILTRARDAVEPGLRAAVRGLPPPLEP